MGLDGTEIGSSYHPSRRTGQKLLEGRILLGKVWFKRLNVNTIRKPKGQWALCHLRRFNYCKLGQKILIHPNSCHHRPQLVPDNLPWNLRSDNGFFKFVCNPVVNGNLGGCMVNSMILQSIDHMLKILCFLNKSNIC